MSPPNKDNKDAANTVAATATTPPKDAQTSARPPNDRTESAHQYDGEGLDCSPKTPTKKSKRKAAKKKHENGGLKDTPVPRTGEEPTAQTISYADAVREGPAEGESGEQKEAKEAVNNAQRDGEDSTSQDAHNGAVIDAPVNMGVTDTVIDNPEKHGSELHPADDATYAEVIKGTVPEQLPGIVEASSDGQDDPLAGEVVRKHDYPDASASQASTAVDYPEIADEGFQEQDERREDQDKAPDAGGIRFAPLRVPLRRRLQTLAVLCHSLCVGTTVSIFFLFCAIPLFWPIIIIYLIAINFSTDATDGKLRRRKEWFRKLPIWTYFAEYYPAKLHKTYDLPSTRKYIFGYHPHGIISHGAWVAFASDALGFSKKFPGITNSLLTLESNFRLPIYREYIYTMGCLSVSKESITNTLTCGGPDGLGMGRAVTIVIGGARESLEAQPKTMRLIIKERKGFVKLALRTGADLVPVLAFGENDLYDQLDPHEHPWLHNMQRYFLRVWKFTLPLLHGRGIFNYDVGLMPYRRAMNVVVGKPIKVVQEDNPDNAEIDRIHTLYMEELQKIWDRYKDEFAKGRKEELQFLG